MRVSWLDWGRTEEHVKLKALERNANEHFVGGLGESHL